MIHANLFVVSTFAGKCGHSCNSTRAALFLLQVLEKVKVERLAKSIYKLRNYITKQHTKVSQPFSIDDSLL